MRKTAKPAALLAAAVLLCSACSRQQPAAKSPDAPTQMINNIMSEAAAAQTTAAPATTEASSGQTTTSADTTTSSQGNSPVDLDLTQMNSTMIYSVIYDMMINPDNYYGKSLIVDGYFDTMVYEENGPRYFFVVVPDATACCVQGIEFLLPDSTYPEDYPDIQADIRVKGIIDRYEEGGQMYTYIKADSVTPL